MKYSINRIILFLSIITFPSLTIGQDRIYSNNWIEFSQKYIRIEIKEKGFYHINFNQLSDHGISISQAESQYIQIFNRGKEIPILIKEDNQIVFYGEHNEGSSDSLLYRPNNQRGNPYYGLYSDIGIYYLTVGKTPGKRIPLVNQPVNNSIESTTWHLEKSVTYFHKDYSNNNSTSNTPHLSQSYFQNNEGWTSQIYKDLESVTYNIKLEKFIKGIANPRIKLMIHGNSLNTNYQVGIKIGENLRDIQKVNFNGIQATTKSIELMDIDVSDNLTSKLQLQSLTKTDVYTTTGRFSIAYYLVEYPQHLLMSGNKSKIIYYPKDSNKQLKKIQIADASINTDLFDISDPYNIKQFQVYPSSDSKGIISMVSNNPTGELKLLATSESKNVSKLSITKFNNYSPSEYNYLIITNNKLMLSAVEYATYRSSNNGGNFKTLVVDISDLYQQFNFGEPSPLAIRNFVDYMISDNNKDKYLLLIGTSSTRYDKIVRELPDDVPGVGYPGSDMLLVTGLQGDHIDIPAIPIGRLSATTSYQVTTYLNKLKTIESNSSDIRWKKNAMHLSGGKTVNELQSLSNSLKNLEPIITEGNLGGSVIPLVKQSLAPTESVDISSQVNNGVGLITYYGHGSATTLDFDIGYASSPNSLLNNIGKYPLMYFNGCGVGNIFSGRFSTDHSSINKIPLSTDWLFAHEKGAIAVIANTWFSYLSTSNQYLSIIYNTLFKSSSNLSIGKIQLEAAREIVSRPNYNLYDIANLHQSLLQGDPALKIIQIEQPDYTFTEFKNITIKSENPNINIGNSENVQVEIAIENAGIFLKNTPIKVKVILENNDNSNKTLEFTVPQLSHHDTIRFNIPNVIDLRSVKAIINPTHEISELNDSNNETVLNIDWEVASNLIEYSSENFKDEILPTSTVLFDNKILKDGALVNKNTLVRVRLNDNLPLKQDINSFRIFIKDCIDESCGYSQIILDDKIDVNIDNDNSKTISIEFAINSYYLLNLGKKEILITGSDQSGNVSQPYKITFEVVEDNPIIELIVSPNPGINYVKFEAKHFALPNKQLNSIDYKIIDLNGTTITQETLSINSQISSEWFWAPNAGGHYFYNINLNWSDNTTTQKRGKIIVLK